MIVFWEMNHFVVVEGYGENRFYLNDPGCGRRVLTAEEFKAGFSGVALEFEPGPKFQRGGDQPNLIKQLPQWFGGLSRPLASIVLCGILLTIPALMAPAALVVFVDHVLSGPDNPLWSIYLPIVLVGAGAVSYVLVLLKNRWLNRLAARLSVTAADRYVSQLLRLTIEFFTHRFAGDLIYRVLSVERIAQTLSVQVFELLIEVVLSAVVLIVMLVISPPAALIVLGLAGLNVFLTCSMRRKRHDRSVALRREQGLMLGVGTMMLNQSETVRMTASDNQYFSRWSGHQVREVAVRQELAELNHVNSAWPLFFEVLSRAAVLVFAGVQVIAGALTLGEMAGLFLLAVMLLSPASRFAEFANQRQVIEADMQRLDDIAVSAADRQATAQSASPASVSTLEGKLKLTGQLELRNISFGYNRSRPPLIENFSLTMEPGQRIAILGASGSGKSTLSRIVSGLYEPWTGEVLYDGYPRKEIPLEVLTRSISVVDQNINLFPASVRENITLWNASVPDETVVAAAKDACIHDEILNRRLGYQAQVAESGENFSGGQKQRIEIARALAGEPVILILDEATSALDAVTEEMIDLALRRRGVSCLIIAHRLSTIRDCDQIIVLQHGVEVQRGTHEELIVNREGVYYRLIQSN